MKLKYKDSVIATDRTVGEKKGYFVSENDEYILVAIKYDSLIGSTGGPYGPLSFYRERYTVPSSTSIFFPFSHYHFRAFDAMSVIADNQSLTKEELIKQLQDEL